VGAAVADGGGQGAHVRKGERGTTIVYADRFTPEDERRRAAETGEEPGAIPFLKRFTVFNTDQCDGLPEVVAASVIPPPLDMMRGSRVCRRGRATFGTR
jgi:antirestriction protein ArdC